MGRGARPARPDVPCDGLDKLGRVKFYQQWEKQLMWATMKALIDHDVFPRGEAIGLARRLAAGVMTEYAPLIERHLAQKT